MAENDELEPAKAEEKQRRCWNMVLSNSVALKEQKLQWPPLWSIFQRIFTADSMSKLWIPKDMLRDERFLCAHGCACLVRLNWFPTVSEKYSGLFAKGSVEGVMRLSSAIEPPAEYSKSSWFSMPTLWAMGEKVRNAVLFPTVAIKVFRDGERLSGNLLFMGSKVGQREKSFFAHSVSTEGTEKINVAMRPILSQFKSYSKYPISSGISNFAFVGGDQPRFPWALFLVPRVISGGVSSIASDMDRNEEMPAFLKELLLVQPGTMLYDIFACPTPAAAARSELIERIGFITTLSEMKLSTTSIAKCPFSKNSAFNKAKVSSDCPSLASKGRLFFQHQKKEEDYDYHPEWISELEIKCSVRNSNGKKVTGTVGYLSGRKLFERLVATGKFIDLEKL